MKTFLILISLILPITSNTETVHCGEKSENDHISSTTDNIFCDCKRCPSLNFTEIKDLQCTEIESCEYMVGSMIVQPNFYWQCLNEQACKEAIITINCKGETINGITCSGLFSCQAAQITFKQCIVEQIKCFAPNACKDMTIILEDSHIINDTFCEPESCDGLVIGQRAIELFVSSNGTDHGHCGDRNNSCGTLYAISTRLENDPFLQITINVDGQNETQIMEYSNSNSYHPCIPKPFPSMNAITINFNNQSVHDWYPRNICGQITKKK
eukprot:126042_1